MFGTGGAGKTSALRTIAAGLARQGDPGTVQLYGLDLGNPALLAAGGASQLRRRRHLGRAFSGWLGALRRNRRLLLLRPENRSEVDQLSGAKVRFRPSQPFPPGRGVLVADRGSPRARRPAPRRRDQGDSRRRSAGSSSSEASIG
ncbi:MAG: FtsK/SpoIIIE domain-containing protein [Actinomycetota bacterium]|nr:FtsK/SpoIIIE domain-containing protein [Actinomycetota bacterium]